MMVGMKKTALLLTFSLAATAVFADGKTATFSAPKDKVYAVALEVIAAHWRIEQANKEDGLISYRSGTGFAHVGKGMGLNLLIVGTDGGSKLIVNSEAQSLLQKETLKLIGQRLWKDGLIPLSEVPGAPKPQK